MEIENRQINITFNNEKDQKEENYILLSQKKEALLIKEELIKNNINNYQIKINELFKTENTEQYYINKEKLKEKYLNNCFELDKKGEDIVFNNKDQNEMNELYREISLKHPRKIINKEIQKYSFLSWTGCFSCQRFEKLEKNEFYSLGLGISSYFKTIKLFIFFFIIIFCVNLVAVYHYSRYTSIINDNNFFFKTTLGNTKITTYNAILYNFKINEFPELKLNCSNKIIGKFIYGLELYKPSSVNNLFNQTEITFNGKDYSHLSNELIHYYNEKIIKECNLTKECNLKIDSNIYNYYYGANLFNDHSNYLYYECIDTTLLPKNTKQNSLRNITKIITIITLIILIILYYYYKFAINIENKNYNRDKVTINNYTLVLHGLKKNSNDYYQELNDLISHLNNIISSEIDPNNFSLEKDFIDFKNNESNSLIKYKNINIFDISISTVDEKKMEIIEKIKSLKDEITDIKEGYDTIEKKVKHKIFAAVGTVTSLYNQIKNKNKNEEEQKEEPFIETIENINEENQKKIDKEKDKMRKQMSIISENEMKVLNMESDKKKYVDIYITFRNPLITNFIYLKYKKNFFERILLFLCCKIKTIKLYYYKGQWLNFDISNNAPSNIKWENCNISTKKKLCRRFFTHFTFLLTIIITTILISIFTEAQDKTESIINSYIITGILKVISIISEIVLEKLTKFEKYSTLSKNITSEIEKYFILNFTVSTISINIYNYYTYKYFDTQYSIIMSSILQSMMFSIVTEHLSTLAEYLFNLFKRYLDSDFENGKKTKLNKRLEYEELYIGPEFPIGERLSSLFVNLGLCLIYGTSCPLIYFFYTLYLITTFIVDKFLFINYYKKPPYYDNYFSLIIQKMLFLSIVGYIYCTIYYISNPYLFNLYQNDSINFGYKGFDFYLFLNPFTIFFKIYAYFSEVSIVIYNFCDLSNIYIILMGAFIFPLITIKIIELFKKIDKISLQNSPNIDIGLIYSLEELNKYYEVKKLELFKFLININKNNLKEFKKYSKLTENYKNVLDYLKQNIDFKNSKNIKKDENNNLNFNNKEESNENIIIEKETNNERLLIVDPSYNLAFISNYEIFEYYYLLYYD